MEHILKISLTSKTKQWVVNATVASLWAYYAYKSALYLHTNWYAASQSILVIQILFFINNSSLTIFFLIRHAPKESYFKVKECMIAIYGTFAPFLYSNQGAVVLVPAKFLVIIYLLMAIFVFFSMLSIYSLGRSFAILPSNRKIRTGGMYRFVRHPLYSLYIHFYICLLLIRFSPLNLAIFISFCLACYLRAKYEEKLLLNDPIYLEYYHRNRYMFIPMIF